MGDEKESTLMPGGPIPVGEMAVWRHSNTVWDKLRTECDKDGIWDNGTITSVFTELGLSSHYSKVMRALKLMERVSIERRSSYRNTGEKVPTRIQLFYPDQPLSIEAWSEIHSEVYGKHGTREKKSRWLTDERLNNLTPIVTALYAKVDELEGRVRVLESQANVPAPEPLAPLASIEVGSLLERPDLDEIEGDF